MSYPGHSLRWGRTPQQKCSRCILTFQPTGLYIAMYNIIILLIVLGNHRDSLDVYLKNDWK